VPPEPVVDRFSGELLRVRREAARLSQPQLGERVGVDKTTISKYETGHRKPGVDRFDALVAELGVDPTDLLSEGPGAGTLAQLRKAAGLTQAEAATEAGLNRTQYSGLERGEVGRLPDRVIGKLAAAYRVTPDEIRSAHSLSLALRETRRSRQG
jgi:transcriptional regulator with XRE-family HTH domain